MSKNSILGSLAVKIGAIPDGYKDGLKRVKLDTDAFQATVRQAGGQMRTSFGVKTQNSIKGTGTAVMNFNRIVQDAPFGLMGISNNIEPMIQSFNQLKKSTGSTGMALKTLVTSALSGPGALITAASFATTGLLLLQKAMGKTKKEAKETKDALEGFGSALDSFVRKTQDIRLGDNASDLDSVKDRYAAITAEIANLEAENKKLEESNTFRGFDAQYGGIADQFKIDQNNKALESLNKTAQELFDRMVVLNAVNRSNTKATLEATTAQQSFGEAIGRSQLNVQGLSGVNQKVVADMSRLKTVTVETKQVFRELSQEQLFQAQALGGAFDKISNTFARTFVDGVSDLNNFGDAFKSMGNVLVQSLKEVAAQLIKMAAIKGIASLLFPSSKGILTGFDLAARIFRGPAQTVATGTSASAGKMALNANLFVGGQQLVTETRFTNQYDSRRFG